jgi:CRISPR-associated endoribonuclease Cas6
LTMITQITLEIEYLPPLQGWTGQRAQAWFLRWVGQNAPELATQLHAGSTRKPYTVSPIDMDDARARLRITSLNPALTELLNDSPPFAHGDQAYSVKEVARESRSFPDLLRLGETGNLPALQFWTPTAFRSGGREITLPLPELVFGSLIQAWDSFSPLRLPLQLRAVAAEHITIARHAIHTRHVSFPHRGETAQRVGFVGRVWFGHNRGIDPVALRFLCALLHFAPFAGVGVGTAAGMGGVRVLSSAS